KKLGGRAASETIDAELEQAIHKAYEKYQESLDNYEVSPSIEAVMEMLRVANAYINREKPWEKNDPSRDLYSLLETVRAASIMLYPVTPRASTRLAEAFGYTIERLDDAQPVKGREYTVNEAPILFKKIV
ncbi:MAG: class I tRNA ligase family protein, partial [Desulfurococcales archaeon]|nr:class I tRNA ligase family protein [Desulfurococcales archaeon]